MLSLNEIEQTQYLDDEFGQAESYGVAAADHRWALLDVPVNGLSNWDPKDVVAGYEDDDDGMRYLKGLADAYEKALEPKHRGLAPPPVIALLLEASDGDHVFYALGGWHRIGATHLAGFDTVLGWVATVPPDN